MFTFWKLSPNSTTNICVKWKKFEVIVPIYQIIFRYNQISLRVHSSPEVKTQREYIEVECYMWHRGRGVRVFHKFSISRLSQDWRIYLINSVKEGNIKENIDFIYLRNGTSLWETCLYTVFFTLISRPLKIQIF